MDVNGTRFHLFFGRPDWAGCSGVIQKPGGKEEPRLLADVWTSDPLPDEIGFDLDNETGLSWDKERHELTLEPRLFNFVPNGSAPSVENRRGAARDRFGNWYWIDETSRKVRVLSAGSRTTTDFWRLPEQCACPEAKSSAGFGPLNELAPAPPIELSGLAVTEDHYLVVGTIDPAGLLIFDLYSGGEPRQISWPAGVPFAPFDMAPRPGGGVWILDQNNHCYWALDRNFNVIGADGGAPLAPEKIDDFQPVDGSSVHQTAARTFPAKFSLAQSPPVVVKPIAIEALPDETVLILDYNPDPAARFSRIHRYRYAERLPDEISTKAILKRIQKDDRPTFRLTGHDFAFVPEHVERGRTVQDRLYVVGADGNQTYAFSVCLRGGKIELEALAEYLPMRLFGGKALVATESGPYYDFAEDWIPLVQQRRPRYTSQATLLTPALDGRDPDCVWHRLMLDACIPPDTRVEVWSRAANDESDLALTQWQREPAPYLRAGGSEIPFLRRPRNHGRASSHAKLGDGTWELLFQRARGRYLQLQLRLSGDERSTPRLSALRTYYPRFSYLTNYLPAVYRDDEQSASFLDRFLANLEGVHTALEERIASAQILFDVRSAPSETLDWLASWFEVALDPSWDEAKRRMFIAHAMDFFQYRGTIRGLTMALRLALDSCADESIFATVKCCKRREDIRIIEKYLTRKMPAVTLGDPTDATGLRAVQVPNAWEPAQGRANLNHRYSIFIQPSGQAAAATIEYPLAAFIPSAEEERAAWQAFLRTRYENNIGSLNSFYGTTHAAFTAVPEPADFPNAGPARNDWSFFVANQAASLERRLWKRFLTQRYGSINRLNQAHRTNWPQFESVSMPEPKSGDNPRTRDWNDFQSAEFEQWRQFSLTTLGFVPAAAAGAERAAWRAFLQGRYPSIATLNAAHATNYKLFAEIRLPRDLPKVAAAQSDWIGFITAPTSLSERRLWQDFLARRYRRIGALNEIYGTAWTGFDVVPLPGELPPDGAPLNDWFQFETVVLRMQGAAHRFTVLLPVPASLAFNTEEHRTRLRLAHRIVDLEKPAHTVFDVRFYWAMFRVGEARLQLDTVIDQGSRAPQLLPNLVLGEGFVGESYLATPAMEAASDRHVLGRDVLGITPH